jgi:hypothetical protein
MNQCQQLIATERGFQPSLVVHVSSLAACYGGTAIRWYLLSLTPTRGNSGDTSPSGDLMPVATPLNIPIYCVAILSYSLLH